MILMNVIESGAATKLDVDTEADNRGPENPMNITVAITKGTI